MKNINLDIYKQIVDESIMAILIFKSQGPAIYANQPARDLIELPLNSDIDHLKLFDLFAPESTDKRLRRLNQDALQMQGLIQEIVIKKLNDRQFIGTLGIKHITIEGELCYLLMMQDVTLQKKLQREITEKQNAIHQAYQELLIQNKQLKDLDMAKNRFIAMTTHELRTPLSAMVASAEILNLKLYDTQEQLEEFIKMIYDQGQHMINLVNDILDFAKISSNKMDYYVEEKDLLPLVENEIEGLQNMAEKSQVTLSIQPVTGPLMCYFDEIRIRQVVSNLVNNAIKYNKTNGEVVLILENHEDFVKLSVRDTGKGIAEEDKAKVFNEFETLGKVANHSKGTGLGLPISLRMIQAMGGQLKLESEVGVGSTFWIEIPKKQVLPPENYRSRPDQSGDLAA